MATLTAVKFSTPGGAEEALGTIQQLASQELVRVHDAAVVTWEEGRRKPKTRELYNMKGAGALSGAFWGMLFGLIFFVPLLGAAVGAAMGALTGSFTDVGISDSFINEVRDKVTPGTSALFLLTSDAVRDRVAEAMRGHDFEILATNLSADQEKQLREAFETEEPVGA
jgi:uncharacterized membrane protein